MNGQGEQRARRGLLPRGVWAIGLGALLFAANPVWANECGVWRPYQGTLTAVGAERVSVSRGGAVASFVRAAGVRVVVRGTPGAWSDLGVGQRVKVCWAFDDEPRAARIVHVLSDG